MWRLTGAGGHRPDHGLPRRALRRRRPGGGSAGRPGRGPAAAPGGPLGPGHRRAHGRAAAALGLAAGTPVVIGAGDRACEVLGAGAVRRSGPWSAGAPRPTCRCRWTTASRAARRGWCCRGRRAAAGCSRAGCRRPARSWPGSAPSPAVHLGRAGRLRPGAARPGARGVVATPWLDGARAPWWRPEARAAFVGLTSAHGPADLARAVFESVAWEVRRCLEAIAGRRPPGAAVVGLALGGARRGHPGVARGADRHHRAARAAPSVGPGRLGRRRPGGRAGRGLECGPRRARPGRPTGRARPGQWPSATRRCPTTRSGSAASVVELDRPPHAASDPPPAPGKQRAADPGLRHRRAGGGGARRRRGGRAQGAGGRWRTRRGRSGSRCGGPVGNRVRRSGRPRWPGGGGLPRPHPADAQHHRAAPAAGRARAGRGRARPGRAAVRHRHPPTGHRRGDGRAGGPRHRGAATGSTTTMPTTGTTSRWGRWTAPRCCSTATTWRPTSAS